MVRIARYLPVLALIAVLSITGCMPWYVSDTSRVTGTVIDAETSAGFPGAGLTIAQTSCPNIEQLECVLGNYSITSVTQYRGGLTPEDVQMTYLKTPVIISHDYFKYRHIEIINPEYKLRVVMLPAEEGIIGPNDVSTFWGYEMSRTKVIVVDVYDGGEFRYDFEVISNNKLWSGYDGFYFEATR